MCLVTSFKWYSGGTIPDFAGIVRGDDPSHDGNIGICGEAVRSRGETEPKESSEFEDCALCSCSDNNDGADDVELSDNVAVRLAVGSFCHCIDTETVQTKPNEITKVKICFLQNVKTQLLADRESK